MAIVVQFRNRPVQAAPPRRFRLSPVSVAWVFVAAAAWAFLQLSSDRPLLSLPEIGSERAASSYFTICNAYRRDNCVIDGDTFAFRGERIRIADIDAPETHPPRCVREARLGKEATRRLQELLSVGSFTLRQSGFRDEDRYGRKLRTVMRDGRSLGAVLVAEGLARQWTGRRLPWCA